MDSKLSNRGERLCLFDALGNCIDEVHYGVEGDWPSLAAGQGSSMELLHPPIRTTNSHRPGVLAYTPAPLISSPMYLTSPIGTSYLFGASTIIGNSLLSDREGHLVLKNIKLSQVHEDKNLLDNVSRRSVENDGATRLAHARQSQRKLSQRR